MPQILQKRETHVVRVYCKNGFPSYLYHAVEDGEFSLTDDIEQALSSSEAFMMIQRDRLTELKYLAEVLPVKITVETNFEEA